MLTLSFELNSIVGLDLTMHVNCILMADANLGSR